MNESMNHWKKKRLKTGCEEGTQNNFSRAKRSMMTIYVRLDISFDNTFQNNFLIAEFLTREAKIFTSGLTGRQMAQEEGKTISILMLTLMMKPCSHR